MSTPQRFRATIQLGGKTATGIPVPSAAVEALAAGRQPQVEVTVAGHTYRSRVSVRGGAYIVPLSAEHREAAGAAAGDEVEVVLALDARPRELVVPDDFAAALAAAPESGAFFAGLSYSRRQRFVLAIEGAKTDETRQRRIAKAVEDLRAGKA
jgi:hypothetical protein